MKNSYDISTLQVRAPRSYDPVVCRMYPTWLPPFEYAWSDPTSWAGLNNARVPKGTNRPWRGHCCRRAVILDIAVGIQYLGGQQCLHGIPGNRTCSKPVPLAPYLCGVFNKVWGVTVLHIDNTDATNGIIAVAIQLLVLLTRRVKPNALNDDTVALPPVAIDLLAARQLSAA
jgi:hypothetical protein